MHSGFEKLQLAETDFNHTIALCFDECLYAVKSNSAGLLNALSDYFGGYTDDTSDSRAQQALVTVFLCEDTSGKGASEYPISWQNWQGEVGKTRLKEQFMDEHDGRWIHKFKTGMVMFQHKHAPIAIGHCSGHLSQMVNFIINQHINHLQQIGGLICHAACLEVGNAGIAIAAHSGGGKSTTMLKLMDLSDSRFVSNDRLFLFNSEPATVAKGVPKQPRVNPGTLLHNPKLTDVLPKDRQTALSQLTPNELWQQEEKYDVMVADIYGPEHIKHRTKLQHVLLLNWQPGSDEPVTLTQISLDERTDLIAAIAKSPGSFYQNEQGKFLNTAEVPADNRYQEVLRNINVWEVTGGADFDALVGQFQDLLGF